MFVLSAYAYTMNHHPIYRTPRTMYPPQQQQNPQPGFNSTSKRIHAQPNQNTQNAQNTQLPSLFVSSSISSWVNTFFHNQTVRDNLNQLLRVLFRALIHEFYPYILATLLFMIISFILLVSIFILIIWRESSSYAKH